MQNAACFMPNRGKEHVKSFSLLPCVACCLALKFLEQNRENGRYLKNKINSYTSSCKSLSKKSNGSEGLTYMGRGNFRNVNEPKS